MSEIKDAKKLKINERVGQAGERIFAQGQGLQIYETAYFVGESGQFVSVQVEFSEVVEIADAAWQMRNLKNQTQMFQFWTICKKKIQLTLDLLRSNLLEPSSLHLMNSLATSKSAWMGLFFLTVGFGLFDSGCFTVTTFGLAMPSELLPSEADESFFS